MYLMNSSKSCPLSVRIKINKLANKSRGYETIKTINQNHVLINSKQTTRNKQINRNKQTFNQ